MTERPNQIYIHRAGQQCGPYSLQDVNTYLANGSLSLSDLGWYEGCADWKPLSQIPGVLLPREHTAANRSDTIGFAMLLVAVVAALLILKSGDLNLSPRFLLGAGVVITAILAGVEAKQLGMGNDTDKTAQGRKRGGPGQTVAWVLLLWIIGFPAYLYSRSKYGARNLLVPGIAVTLACVAASFFARPSIHELEEYVKKNIEHTYPSEMESGSIHRLYLVHKSGNQYEGIIEIERDGGITERTIDVTYDGNHLMWQIRP